MLEKYFKPQYKIIEVDTPRDAGALTSEMKASLSTLSGHPGFRYLLAKLKVQRALLETRLKNDRHKSIIDVEFLQSGIHWSKWLEDQLSLSVNRTTSGAQSLSPTVEELSALDQIRTDIELVGQ